MRDCQCLQDVSKTFDPPYGGHLKNGYFNLFLIFSDFGGDLGGGVAGNLAERGEYSNKIVPPPPKKKCEEGGREKDTKSLSEPKANSEERQQRTYV